MLSRFRLSTNTQETTLVSDLPTSGGPHDNRYFHCLFHEVMSIRVPWARDFNQPRIYQGIAHANAGPLSGTQQVCLLSFLILLFEPIWPRHSESRMIHCSYPVRYGPDEQLGNNTRMLNALSYPAQTLLSQRVWPWRQRELA